MTTRYLLQEIFSGFVGNWEMDNERNSQLRELCAAQGTNGSQYRLELRSDNSGPSCCFNHGIRYDINIMSSTENMLCLHFVPREEFFFHLTEYFFWCDDNNIRREQRVSLTKAGGSLISAIAFVRTGSHTER